MMSSPTASKPRKSQVKKLLDYFRTGSGLTANEARARFGVKNFSARISEIRAKVERYGNWQLNAERTSTGKTRYFVDPTMD